MISSPLELGEIADLVWSTQLGLQLEPIENGEPGIVAEDDDLMTGVVQITGGFAGSLHVCCPRELVAVAAAKMFFRPVGELPIEDLRDALGELANMTAGNLKSRLPGANSVSLPTVVEGSDYEITPLDSDVVAATRLRWEDHVMAVTLFANRKT